MGITTYKTDSGYYIQVSSAGQTISSVCSAIKPKSLPDNDYGKNRWLIVFAEDHPVSRYASDTSPQGEFFTESYFRFTPSEARTNLELPPSNFALFGHEGIFVRDTTAEIAEMKNFEVPQFRLCKGEIRFTNSRNLILNQVSERNDV